MKRRLKGLTVVITHDTSGNISIEIESGKSTLEIKAPHYTGLLDLIKGHAALDTSLKSKLLALVRHHQDQDQGKPSKKSTKS